MRYWWVNHKGTFRTEIDGGFIWSPKRKKNGHAHRSYTNLTLVEPGETVISYANQRIAAIGTATGKAREEPKSELFGLAGKAWEDTGWLVPIEWFMLPEPVIPALHLERVLPLLPVTHSPLNRETGAGLQSCYLAEIGQPLHSLIVELADVRLPTADVEERSELAERAILESELPETDKLQLILARKGQGRYRANLESVESRCRLTGLADKRFLVASHIKPWCDCTNSERLDGNNGLLLSPHVDRLFDKGWISFDDDGAVLLAHVEVEAVMKSWGLVAAQADGMRSFNAEQRRYLDHHRSAIFKGQRPQMPG